MSHKTIASIRAGLPQRRAWFAPLAGQVRPENAAQIDGAISDAEHLLKVLDMLMGKLAAAVEYQDMSMVERLVEDWNAAGANAPQPTPAPAQPQAASGPIQPGEYAIPTDAKKPQKCRYCDAELVWARVGMKHMPLDISTARTLPDGRTVAMTHFSNCPGAEQARKK